MRNIYIIFLCIVRYTLNKLLFIITHLGLSIWIIKRNLKRPESTESTQTIIKRNAWKKLFSLILNNCDLLDQEWIYKKWIKRNELSSISDKIFKHFIIIDKVDKETHTLLNNDEIFYIVIIEPGGSLARNALSMIDQYLLRNNCDITLVYGDYDYIINGERFDPQFVSNWDKFLFLSFDYTGPLLIVKKDFFHHTKIRDEISINELKLMLLIKAIKQDLVIYHIPYILSHISSSFKSMDIIQRKKMLEKSLQEIYPDIRMFPYNHKYLKYSFFNINSLPLVSLIIPSRNNFYLLQNCIKSVIKKTNYPYFEIIIVDHNNTKKDSYDYLTKISAQENISIIKYTDEFNFSKINNIAAQQSKGRLLCFLNDDTEVISENWLLEMADCAELKETGAVGAKLLYYDNTIQHVGVALGIKGIQGHMFRGLRESDLQKPEAILKHEVASVTAACMVIRKEIFIDIDGFDESFAVSFNDLDLCLRLREKGYTNIVNPHAVLYHHEGLSRGSDFTGRNKKRYLKECKLITKKWNNILHCDPYINPNLSLSSEDLRIKI